MSLIEIYALMSAAKLAYVNHMIGFIVMSVSSFMFFLTLKRKFRFGKYYDAIGKAGFYLYSVVAQVIYLFLVFLFPMQSAGLLPYLGLFTLIVTLLLSTIYARMKTRNTATPKGEDADEAPV
jgi:hypothetical protein